MRPKNNEKTTFWQWFNKYRAKIGILVFTIAIPLSLVLIAYIGPYYSNKKVHFDEDKVDVQRHFDDIDDLEALSLDIVWTELVYPVYTADDPDEILSHGQYNFIISYEPKGAYNISSVSITPVLHTDWFAFYSVGTKTSIYTNARSVSVLWDEPFPMRKLLFIEVNEPNLYLKVEYAYISADETINETVYVMYSLKDMNPSEVS